MPWEILNTREEHEARALFRDMRGFRTRTRARKKIVEEKKRKMEEEQRKLDYERLQGLESAHADLAIKFQRQ